MYRSRLTKRGALRPQRVSIISTMTVSHELELEDQIACLKEQGFPTGASIALILEKEDCYIECISFRAFYCDNDSHTFVSLLSSL
jgi:hypothetical protein